MTPALFVQRGQPSSARFPRADRVNVFQNQYRNPSSVHGGVAHMDPAWIKRWWPLLAGIAIFSLVAAGGLLMGIWPEFGDDSASGPIESVNARSFNEKVLQSEVPVLVYFYADWCGPCQMQAPILEDLAHEASDFAIVQVNIDKSPELANRFQIESIPSLLLFRDGRLENRHVGLANKTVLKQLLSPLSP